MRIFITLLSLIAAAALTAPVLAQETPAAIEPVPPAVEQLRHVIGVWDVETDFIGPDGAIRATVPGRYEFTWIMPDRIVSGWSELPTLNQKSALLFFHRPADSEIEMASVGADGRLWRMIGPDDGETRTTPDQAMADGSTMMLRFTRHDVTPDRFGSMMEMSSDGGKTWRLGNRQRFVRARAATEN